MVITSSAFSATAPYLQPRKSALSRAFRGLLIFLQSSARFFCAEVSGGCGNGMAL
jgi:hypothetical protein